MTSPSDLSIEDRLRAHFDDEARRVPIPGPETDTKLAQARAGVPLGPEHGDDLVRRRPRRPARLLAAAAVVAVIALVAGVAMARRDDRGDVSTDPRPPEPTPTTEPSPPGTTEAPPATTATTAPPPTPVGTGPIVGRDGILGSWDGRSWVRWTSGDPAPSAREYQLVGLFGPPTTVTGNPVVAGCGAIDRPTVDVGIDRAADASQAGIAVAGAGIVEPRPVEILDPAAEVYRQAAAEVAESLGIVQPDPRVAQVVRADLEGDGSAEVLVMAEQLIEPSSSMASPGDWSVAFVRRVVGGTVQTSVVESHTTTEHDAPFLSLYRVGAVADLNGDGRLEVVVNQRYYEGSSTSVYEYGTDGTLREVLSAGCGV
jgi:hypothetical protein